MRIAHIGPATVAVGYTVSTAVERRMVDLALAQQDRGDTVLVFSAAPSSPHPRPPGPARKLRIIDIACRRRPPLDDMELVLRARAALLRVEPDVIHVHNSITAALGLAGIRGVKLLSFDHFRFPASERRIPKALFRRALTSFDLLLPTSEWCARAAADYWSLPLSRFRALYSGVEAHPLVIGCVGQLCGQAEIDLLADAMELVRRVHPQATLMAVGGQAAPDVVRSLDICVISDPLQLEATAAQMLSAGIPVVCSSSGRLGDAGPGAAAALAEELIAMCDDQAALARVVAARADAIYREALS